MPATYRFRITDGHSIAFELTAANERQLQVRLIEALHEFRQAKGMRREFVKFHAWDGEWWVDVRSKSRRVIKLCERMLYEQPGYIAEGAFRTAWSANRMTQGMRELKEFLVTGNSKPPRLEIVGKWDEQ